MSDAMSRSIAEMIEGRSTSCPNCASLLGEVKFLHKSIELRDIEISTLQVVLSRYKQALIWAMENGDYADMSSRIGPKDEWDDELRRRVGEYK